MEFWRVWNEKSEATMKAEVGRRSWTEKSRHNWRSIESKCLREYFRGSQYDAVVRRADSIWVRSEETMKTSCSITKRHPLQNRRRLAEGRICCRPWAWSFPLASSYLSSCGSPRHHPWRGSCTRRIPKCGLRFVCWRFRRARLKRGNDFASNGRSSWSAVPWPSEPFQILCKPLLQSSAVLR